MAVVEYGDVGDAGDEDIDFDVEAEEKQELRQDEYEQEEEEEEESEEEDDADPVGTELNEIYYCPVIDKKQGDQVGPINYAELKKRYGDSSYEGVNYMTTIRDPNEMPQWTQIFKNDKIFKDLDRQRYKEIKSKSKSKSKPKNKSDDNDDDYDNKNKSKSPPKSQGLAQPMSIKEMKEKEAKEEQERLKNQENDNKDRPLYEEDASYHSNSCCNIL